MDVRVELQRRLSAKELMQFEKLQFWRRLLKVPRTARRSNQSILKEINLEYSLERLMTKLKLQYFGHLVWRPWCWARLKNSNLGAWTLRASFFFLHSVTHLHTYIHLISIILKHLLFFSDTSKGVQKSTWATALTFTHTSEELSYEVDVEMIIWLLNQKCWRDLLVQSSLPDGQTPDGQAQDLPVSSQKVSVRDKPVKAVFLLLNQVTCRP